MLGLIFFNFLAFSDSTPQSGYYRDDRYSFFNNKKVFLIELFLIELFLKGLFLKELFLKGLFLKGLFLKGLFLKNCS